MNAVEMHQRADNLEPASPSFFVFLSHDDIFIAQQRRQRWSMCVATEAAMATRPFKKRLDRPLLA
jgi:hypothetical protein